MRHFGLWKGYRGSTLFTELNEQEEERREGERTDRYNIHQDETHIALSFKTRHTPTYCVRNPDCIVTYDTGDTVCVMDFRSRVFAL